MEFIIPYIKMNTIEHGNVPLPPSVRDIIVEENDGDNITEQENFLNENTQTNEFDPLELLHLRQQCRKKERQTNKTKLTSH